MSTLKSVIVLPSMKVTGGTHQALRLGTDLQRQGATVSVATLWTTPHPLGSSFDCVSLSEWRAISWLAPAQLPLLMLRFIAWARKLRRQAADVRFVFTHYSTLPFAMLVPRRARFVFVQDLEWKFLRHPLLSAVVRLAILFCYRRCAVIAANSYLAGQMRSRGLRVVSEVPIWADPGFLAEGRPDRDIDFVMVLRKGDHKRLDLYLAFIAAIKACGHLRLAAITPEDDIREKVSSELALCLSRPTLEEMRDLYGRSKCFVHLSDHEGFGLPPLEAMGAGCVPLCRDSGGVRAFISGEVLESLLIPLNAPIAQIVTIAVNLVRDSARWEALSRRCQISFRAGLDVDERRMIGIQQIIKPAT